MSPGFRFLLTFRAPKTELSRLEPAPCDAAVEGEGELAAEGE